MRLALCGYGRWGRNLARAFDRLGVLARIVDPDEDACEAARDAWPHVECTKEVARAFASDIDAVALATPIETHAALALAAIEAGKDVFCEKPLATSLEAALRVRAAARAGQRVVMVGHVLEYHPAIAAMRARVEAGAIGTLVAIESKRVQPPGTRRCDALWELAVHDVGVVLGTASSRATSVSACVEREGDGELVDVRLRLDSGVRARVRASSDGHERGRRMRIVGTRGAIDIDEIAGTVELRAAGAAHPLAVAAQEPLARECRAFVDAVATRSAPTTDVEMALEVVRVLHAAERSIARAGAMIALAPEASPRLASAS